MSDASPLACRNSERSAVSRQGEEEETQGGRQGEGDSRFRQPEDSRKTQGGSGGGSAHGSRGCPSLAYQGTPSPQGVSGASQTPLHQTPVIVMSMCVREREIRYGGKRRRLMKTLLTVGWPPGSRGEYGNKTQRRDHIYIGLVYIYMYILCVCS